jgi:hypothetical protein
MSFTPLRALGVLGLCASMVAPAACSSDASERPAAEPEPGATAKAPAAQVAATPAAEAPPAPPSPRPERRWPPTSAVAIPLRVTTLTPAEGGPVAVGEALPPLRVIETGEHALTLDFELGGRVMVDAHARFARSDASPMGITLGEGSLEVILPPGGSPARPPLRVVTPAGTLEIGGSGEAFVSVLPDGTAWVAQLAGLGDVMGPDLEAKRLVAGRSLRLGGSAARPIAGPSTVAAARTAASRLARGLKRATPADLAVRREALASAVAERLLAFDEELANGRELQRVHREAVSARNPGAMEIQSQVVLHSQALLRTRQKMQLTWESAGAASVYAQDDGAWLALLRERVSRAVPSLRDLSAGVTPPASVTAADIPR